MPNQPVILIASVLKPVSDPRMFEKFAVSFPANFQIHIIGTPIESPLQKPKNIFFHAPERFNRKSNSRLFFGKFFWIKLNEIKPNLLIINSPELLFYAWLYKIKYRKPVIYDIRENYFKNLWHQKNYAFPLRNFLAIGVRMVEIWSRFFVDFYLLAEKSYQDELLFTKGKNAVIENKFSTFYGEIKKQEKIQNTSNIHFIYTGTVSEVYGTLEAIDLIKKLHHLNSNIRLTIIGHCSDENYLQKIIQNTKNQNFITLKISNQPVPHHQILEAITKADFGILSYQPNPSTKACVPTKIYEFLALQTPVGIPKNPLWESLVLPYQAGVAIDFQNVDAYELWERLQNTTFFTQPVSEEVWAFEHEAFYRLVERFL